MSREIDIAGVNELHDGEMKGVEVEGLKIVVTRLEGEFYAIGGECSHYGGPLAEGVLCGEEVTCPWHQARYLVKTGELLNPPALDAMARFEVKVAGDRIVVILPEEPAGTRVADLARHVPQADRRTFIILGGGAAGNAAAQKLRQEGFQGRLLLISKEKRLPYDRTILSKGYLNGSLQAEALPLRNEDFYRKADIELILGQEVHRLEVPEKKVFLQDKTEISYDSLLLATGGIPRKLTVPGADLEKVFLLRAPEDADRIIAAAGKAQQVVVVGTGFIGMETAAALRQRGLAVTVVGAGEMPLEKVLGKEIGAMWLRLHEDKGVRFKLGKKVSRLEGTGSGCEVVLDNGERLAADLVLVGLGINPALDFLQGLNRNPDGSVSTDKYLRVAEGLYAAGDVARFPDWRTGEPMRIEHWQVAEAHGFAAARNMLGQQQPFAEVPFFWTEQFDMYLYYVGYAASWDEIVWHGDPEEQKFLAFFVKYNQIMAAAGCGYDHGMAYVGNLMRLGQMPASEEIRSGRAELLKHLEE
jgi:NADPH-dependent 2,4-dienoyl-CoA reductase/sulfur reductase-like enzyme/nitrite reductase/ring-hydroxylating ferredoxin subunit